MALLQRARFTTALAACGIGLGVCGVTLAVAGESPRPPADPLADAPPDVETVQDTPCNPDMVSGANVGMPPGAFGCYHVMIVRSSKQETGTQLADRLAEYYSRRGFNIPPPGGLEPRTYFGQNACKTMLYITTSPADTTTGEGAVPGPDGLNGLDPATSVPDPTAGAGGPTGPGGPAGPGAAGEAGPVVTPPVAGQAPQLGAVPQQPGPAVTSTTVPAAGAAGEPRSGKPVTTPPISRPANPSPSGGAANSTIPGGTRAGSEPGGEVVLSAQVMETEGGLC